MILMTFNALLKFTTLSHLDTLYYTLTHRTTHLNTITVDNLKSAVKKGQTFFALVRQEKEPFCVAEWLFRLNSLIGPKHIQGDRSMNSITRMDKELIPFLSFHDGLTVATS